MTDGGLSTTTADEAGMATARVQDRSSGAIEVHQIPDGEAGPVVAPPPRASRRRPNLSGYLLTTLIVAAVGLLARALASVLPLPDLSIVFLIAVLIGAVRWGLGASIYAAVLSVLVYDFFFVDPLYTFTIASAQDVVALIVFLVVAVLTSNLTVRVRVQAEAARQREKRTAALYALSQQLARAADLEDIVETIVSQVAQILGAQAAVLLPRGNELAVAAASQAVSFAGDCDRTAAMWAWERGQVAGYDSNMLPGAEYVYAPLTTVRGTVGVLAVRFIEAGHALDPDERRMLQALAGQSAVAIERANLARDMAQAQALAESERLRSALLSSVSHDLRTPLASVIGSATSLLSYGASYDAASQQELLHTILEEAERLDRFVANLLDMTRLESGALQLRRDWVEVQDVIGSALARQGRLLSNHEVKIAVAPQLPLVLADFVLLEQVLVNLLENAAKYSPPHTAIHVVARQADRCVVIEVSDEGAGVPAQDLERIFDKFYRVFKGDSYSGGTGLGLSICRGIVEAHGGRVTAHRRSDGPGTVLEVTLPIAEPDGSDLQGATSDA